MPSTAQVRGWKIGRPTAIGEELNSDQCAAADPMHGYTLADVDKAARIGIARSHGWHAGDVEERFAVARLAIVEYLYAEQGRPHFGNLINQALLADHRFVAGEMREHGINRAERGGGWTAAFERYWSAGAANIPSPEGRIVERLAVQQIMPLLADKQQQAVTALAAHGDYAAAAEALALTVSALDARLSKARRTFAQAWHEHETPRSQLTRDRRTWSRAGTGPDGRRRLTESEVQRIRERHLAGELVRDMAAEVGITRQALHRLLRGASRPAPDPAGA